MTGQGCGRRATLALSLLAWLQGATALSAKADGMPASAAEAKQRKQAGVRIHRLPADPSAVILRWDSLGGMSPEPEQPALLLQASGDFTARPQAAGAARRAGHLDSAGVQALLHEVIDTQRFASITAAPILAEIAAAAQRTGRQFEVRDGGETRITLSLPDLKHSVSFPALHAAQALFPEIDALRRLRAVQLRLLAVAELAR